MDNLRSHEIAGTRDADLATASWPTEAIARAGEKLASAREQPRNSNSRPITRELARPVTYCRAGALDRDSGWSD